MIEAGDVVVLAAVAGCRESPLPPVSDAPPVVDAGPLRQAEEPGPGDPNAPAVDAGPRGNVVLSDVIVTRGNLTNREPALARLRSRLRRCYDQGAREDPARRGEARLDVALNGEPAPADVVVKSGSLSAAVVTCMKRQARVDFEPSGAGGAELTMTVTCTPP